MNFTLRPLPDPHVMVFGAKLSQVHPHPLLYCILEGMSNLEFVPSQFGLLPHGSPLSYHCLPMNSYTVSLLLISLHSCLPGFSFGSNLAFIPTHHQTPHVESIKVVQVLSHQTEEGTRVQSKCAAWAEVHWTGVTASMVCEVSHVVGDCQIDH